MRIPHATALLAAFAVVACSSQDSQANGASAQAPVTATATAAVAVAPAPTTLKAAMKAIEDDWKKVEAAIDQLKKGGAPLMLTLDASVQFVLEEELQAAYAPWVALEVTDEEDGWILMTARKA